MSIVRKGGDIRRTSESALRQGGGQGQELKFRIGEYYEYYQGHATSHKEKIIEAKNLATARTIAHLEYGWGAWATEENQVK